ncbi:EAL domain-containing protein [Vibrio fluvialis]|uniref:EAL domain-containing protein n=1 Tax=Vibrio fluvialis TaxID=676 RepID=UPI00192A738D|nr:EAL domain-containing protein [Vibrio fluvialis]MBL4305481.1 EAL domain-containing protein [Vibrio fluvialis]MBY7768607.1 EAL domain-containing protein [Vibrio fluvialis]MBY7791363.1 EAL domain-containing protein [Vibrio fluvialis]MBY8042564.1 EAL domain-containing protein [Vibrio fluvialis]MBY8051448.1 EAL domain-containing protein [Vibrio fluvialis]
MPESDSPIKPVVTNVSSPARFVPLHWTLDIENQTFNHYADQVNDLMAPLLAFSALEQWLALFDLQAREQAEQLIEQVLTQGDKRALNAVLRLSPDRAVYVVFSVERLSKQLLQGDIQPIFELTQVEQAIHWLEALLNHSAAGLLITNREHKVMGCNSAFERFTGFQQSDLLGLSSLWLFEESTDITGTSQPRVSIKHTSGISQAYHHQSIRLMDNDDHSVVLSLFSLVESAPALRACPVMDKAAFIAQFESLHQNRMMNDLYVVMTLSVQQVNGAQLSMLLDVMPRLKECRLFGKIRDDLYLLCVTCPLPIMGEPFRYIHARIRGFFQELKQASAETHRTCIQGKIGISVLGLDAHTARMAVTHSVQAILEQGEEGEAQRIRFFDTQLHRQIKKRRLLEELVTDAIRNQSLLVEFQPIIDARLGQVMSYEALCRFPLPAALEVSNSELISIAEDLDLISELDLQVQQQALRQWPILQAQHEHPIWLTVNISPNTRQGLPALIQCLRQLMASEQVPAERIIIDITQAKYHSQALVQSNALQELRQLGVQIAIDDMGTDYSLFEHLSASDFDYLKISRSCIDGLGNQTNRYQVIKMLVEMCHSLGVKVIAEGVESEEEAQLLAFGRLDYLQGFYFAKPLAIDDLLAFIESTLPQRLQLITPQEESLSASSLMSLHHAHSPRLDPGDPISLAYQYFQSEDVEVLPVIIDQECVGLVDRARLNLHLTPGMGSELETMKEASMWHRPVNQVMELTFTSIDAAIDVSQIPLLIREHHLGFPWILTKGKIYKGILTQSVILQYLVEQPQSVDFMI